MSPKKASAQIKELLDHLSKSKVNREKLSLVARIKLLLEIIEAPIRKQKEKDIAANAQKRIIKKALKQFITALDRIYRKHGELGDTAVREKMTDAIYDGFIMRQKRYKVPESFGMFSDEGNRLVREAIGNFFTHPEVAAADKSLKTPDDRLIAFQDGDAKSPGGRNYFDYFGYTNMGYILSRRGLLRRF